MKKFISCFAIVVLLLACSKQESIVPSDQGSAARQTLKGKPGGGGGGGTLVVTTFEATNVSRFNATVGGSVSKGGGGTQVTERGICWDINPAPTTDDNKKTSGSGWGSFSCNLSGLSPVTTYYARAYAIKDNVTTYGNEINFTTLETNFSYYGTVTDYDGNVYNAVAIGTQVWMVDNLKTTHYRDGTPIDNFSGDWNSISTGAFCDYNNDPSNSSVYGRLYNWYAVSDPHNIAPEGWHVPSEVEWMQLINYFGGTYVAAGNLKEYGTEHWLFPNLAYANESGFDALPGGRRSGNLFVDINRFGCWWSSTEYPGTTNAKHLRMYAFEENTLGDLGIGSGEGWNNKHQGYSLLCVKDN